MAVLKTQLYFDTLPSVLIQFFALSLHPEQLRLICKSQDPVYKKLKTEINSEHFGEMLLNLHFPINKDVAEDFHRTYHLTSQRPGYSTLEIFFKVYDHQYNAFDSRLKNFFYLVNTNNLEALKLEKPSFTELLDIKKPYHSYPSFHVADESRESNIIFAAARLKRQAILDYFYQLGMCRDETKYFFQRNLQTLVGSALHLATICNQESVCADLIANGADLTAIDARGCSPLHLASQYGHLNLVRVFISHGTNVRVFLGRGSNVRALNRSQESPLHLAAHYGHTEIAASLITAGADQDATDSWGNSPVYIATLRGHSKVVELLQSPRTVGRDEGRSPISVAARSGHIHALEIFAKHRLNTDYLLGEAVRYRQEEVVEFMLKRKANPNYKVRTVHKDMGFTNTETIPVIQMAARSNSITIVRLLLEAGANIFINGEEKTTWANIAGISKQIPKMVQDQERKLTKIKHLAKLERLVADASDPSSKKLQGIILLYNSINIGFESLRLSQYRMLLAKDPELKEMLDYWFPISFFTSLRNSISWFSDNNTGVAELEEQDPETVVKTDNDCQLK